MTTTFVAVTGQRDNLGDSLLRRPLLVAAQGAGVCHVLVGRGAEDWTNLPIRPKDVLYSDRRKWLWALTRSASRTRTNLVLNAGEMVPDKEFRLGRVAILPIIALLKARGGALVHAGFGLRTVGQQPPLITRILAGSSDLTSWRDEASRAAVGIGTVAPDWAFGEGASEETIGNRHADNASPRILALSIRGDRPIPSPEWISAVRSALDTLDAAPMVVCQVRRDRDRAAWLADQLEAPLHDWPEDIDHEDQEARIRSAYSRATWVASDRLHALVAAITEGAVPLDLVTDRSRKASRTLAAAGLVLLPTANARDRLHPDRAEVRSALKAARARLNDQRIAIDLILRGQRQKRIRVLHSMAAPDQATRYSRHMAATEDFAVRPYFLGWTRLLFGRLDIFHLHWPEHFLPEGGGIRNIARRKLARIAMGRLSRRSIPIVRTLHNIAPHVEAETAHTTKDLARLNDLTSVEIHLVPGDPKTTNGIVSLIPHGSYVDPYAVFQTNAPTPGRLLNFGRLASYKGINELLTAAKSADFGELRIVGAPEDEIVVESIENAVASDSRISCRFGFVDDHELASEIASSSLCVFPYRELHSSGAVLVALSLNRPILVPRTTTTEALQQEVGSKWVRIYEHLDGEELEAASEWATSSFAFASHPDLSARTWSVVRHAHTNAYRSALAKATRMVDSE